MRTLKAPIAGMSVEVCAHCHTKFGSILLPWASVHQDDNLDQRDALELWSRLLRTFCAGVAHVMVKKLGDYSELIHKTITAMNNV